MASRFSDTLRIIWAIAVKDLRDAFGNKTVVGVMGTAAMLLIVYRFLPLFSENAELPKLIVNDAGRSFQFDGDQAGSRFEVEWMSSQLEMEAVLRDLDTVALGLSIPAELDWSVQSGERIRLDGYVVHWASEKDIEAARTFFEEELALAWGSSVAIEIAGRTVYTTKDSSGFAFLSSISILLTILIIGMLVSPQLMLEERLTKTMNALLVSPANIGQLIAGKALAGLVFSMAAAGVALLVNAFIVTHWALASLVALCACMFTVSLGLLIGSLFKVRQQIQIWTWICFIPLMLPPFLSLSGDLLPGSLADVLRWVPTVALASAFRVSFSETAYLADFVPELAFVLLCSGVILTFVAFIIKRTDRKGI
ncbi:MAG TPA: ABC transporter permease [Anaerolineae bacterium]|nr:ABC transporter permease [Anaerolineae bacterium]